MKEERLAILRMLENGTISVDEAERLLNAVKETGDKMDFSESLNTFFCHVYLFTSTDKRFEEFSYFITIYNN